MVDEWLHALKFRETPFLAQVTSPTCFNSVGVHGTEMTFLDMLHETAYGMAMLAGSLVLEPLCNGQPAPPAVRDPADSPFALDSPLEHTAGTILRLKERGL
jgi:hypothetical protein